MDVSVDSGITTKGSVRGDLAKSDRVLLLGSPETDTRSCMSLEINTIGSEGRGVTTGSPVVDGCVQPGNATKSSGAKDSAKSCNVRLFGGSDLASS